MVKNYEQVKKINAKCKNGFKFDYARYVFFREKQLYKKVQITDKDFFDVEIFFDKQKSGYIPSVRFIKWSKIQKDGEEVYESTYKKVCPFHFEYLKRTSMKWLYEGSEKYSDEVIVREIAEEIERIKKAA